MPCHGTFSCRGVHSREFQDSARTPIPKSRPDILLAKSCSQNSAHPSCTAYCLPAGRGNPPAAGAVGDALRHGGGRTPSPRSRPIGVTGDLHAFRPLSKPTMRLLGDSLKRAVEESRRVQLAWIASFDLHTSPAAHLPPPSEVQKISLTSRTAKCPDDASTRCTTASAPADPPRPLIHRFHPGLPRVAGCVLVERWAAAPTGRLTMPVTPSRRSTSRGSCRASGPLRAPWREVHPSMRVHSRNQAVSECGNFRRGLQGCEAFLTSRGISAAAWIHGLLSSPDDGPSLPCEAPPGRSGRGAVPLIRSARCPSSALPIGAGQASGRLWIAACGVSDHPDDGLDA